MSKKLNLFLSFALVASAIPAVAQTDSGVLPSSNSGVQQQDDGCLDSSSATCVPQSSYSNGTSEPSANYGSAYGTQNSNTPGALPSTGDLNAQALTQPEYRDENALPNQREQLRNRYYQSPPEPLSEFQKFVAETTGMVLPIFGERLFRNVPTTFAPIDQIPVPANAVVGPGDLLRIRIWGQVNFSDNIRVDRSGEIYLPQVGPIHVAGLPYSDLESHVRTAIARVYRNFQVAVQLGQIRSIQVYVVGRARRPGTYTVSSLSTLIDALFASGGPAADGSLRHILLKRDGVTVTDLDLYQLLVRGDKSGDVKLQPGDVIFIPAVGPQIAVLGSVKNPGIYEEKSASDTVGDMIDDAAGVTAVAGEKDWSVERLINRSGRTVERINLSSTGLGTEVGDGDILRVEPAVPSYHDTITLRGNTANPGRYAWHAGMHLSDLFPDRAALLTRNYWWQWTQLGLPSPEFERVPSLARMIQPNSPESIPLTEEDRRREQQDYRQALEREREQRLAASGQRMNADSSTTANQTAAAGAAAGAGANGDLNNGADLADQQSLNAPNDTTSDNYLDNSQNPDGQPGSRDQFSSAPGSAGSAQKAVRTENTANAQTRTDVTLPAPEIDWSYAVIERLDPVTLKTTLIPFDLGRLVIDHDPSQNLELQPGDVVTVFSQADIHVPVEQQTRLVHLEGEFRHAGVYSVRPGETLQELVERAGGLAPGAYLFGSEFTRVSVQAVQQRQLDQYVDQLQLQIERGVLSTSSSAASSSSDLASAAATSSEARQLIARLKQVRASGRIVLDLHAFSNGADALPPLQLEDGDTFYVPSVPSSVSVIGAVYDQTSFLYAKGDRVRDYVRLAGGENRDADKKHPFVIRADGSVISRNQVGEKKFNAIVIQPGDTIVISDKTFGPSKLRAFLDFSQLFSQLAIGAAVLNDL
jgi:protein involved in polysaccharide export with SLBB domain